MSMLGAKKMKARRAAEKQWRDLVAYWLINGHNLNEAILPKELPRYMIDRIVEEERIKFFGPRMARIARMVDAAAEAMRTR